MGTCSVALYTCLASDLSPYLPSIPFERLFEPKVRGAAFPGVSVKEYSCLALLDSILKKYQDVLEPGCDDRALAKFVSCNTRCSEFASIDQLNMSEIQAICLGEFKSAFHDFWLKPDGTYWLELDKITENLATGPGASIGVSGQSYYHKVAASKLTGTSKSLYALYTREASKCPLWEETEKIRFNHFGGFVEVKGSRLQFVPKTNLISRTICTEPSLNMMLQKGVASQFESRLQSKFGISLAVQPDKNRKLAEIGSLTGTYGTIDLSSASDSISLGLLREICPPYILARMMETRSPLTSLPNGEDLQLHMVSSMGNAFTFPLQTILFSCVVLGVYRALGIKPIYPRGKTLGNFAVFGDDIIVRCEAYDLVTDLLRRIGFEVNLDKSYNSGTFRESCGSDFMSGQPVRGIYCASLKTPYDVLSLTNRLNTWSCNHGVALPRTIGLLLKSLPKDVPSVPAWESDVAGLKLPLRLLGLNSMKRDKWTGSIVYQRYVSRARELNLLSVEQRPQVLRQGNMIHNPAGILLGALRGYIRDGKLSLRQNIPFFKKRIAIAPCWDWHDTCHSTFTSDGWQNFLSGFVELNLK